MNIKSEESLRERLRILTNENKNDKINKFIFFKRLNNNKDKEIIFKSFSDLKSKILQKYSQGTIRSLKNKRLNQIFNKEKDYHSYSFIQKLEQVFNETYNINSWKKNGLIRGKTEIKPKNIYNSKLFLYIKKKKKNNNQSFNFNNSNNCDKIINNRLINISERKNNFNKSTYNNYLNSFLKINKNSTTYKIKNVSSNYLYKNINKKKFLISRLNFLGK